MKRLIAAMLAASMLSACAYNAPVTVSPNLNVYSSYGERLPGTYALFIDSEAFSQKIHATGINCAAHNFPLDMRDSFRQSVITTVQQLVGEVEVVQSPLSAGEMARSGKRGQIIVRADSMTAHVQFIPGFWTATAEGNVDLTANLTVDAPNGRMLGTTAEGEGTAQGEAGAFCGGGANVMAMAAEKATKHLLGELGERFSNSPRLRAASGPEASPAAYAAPPSRPASAAYAAPPSRPSPTTRTNECGTNGFKSRTMGAPFTAFASLSKPLIPANAGTQALLGLPERACSLPPLHGRVETRNASGVGCAMRRQPRS